MTEEPKTKRSKRVKLSPAEKETRNEILKKMQENGEFERYATLKEAIIINSQFSLMRSSQLQISFRLRSTLYAQLMLQDSWRDEMKEKTREAVKQSGGASEITMDELTQALIPCGSSRISPHVEADMKKRIRRICF
jgi:hypothetical protein